jgi:hypothetical protein
MGFLASGRRRTTTTTWQKGPAKNTKFYNGMDITSSNIIYVTMSLKLNYYLPNGA